jgi:hypothetical protein
MQSDEMKEDYNTKLDEIIEFFKTEKETKTFYIYIGKEDSKFKFNVVLSIMVIIVGVITILFNIDPTIKNFILGAIGVTLILLAFYMIFDLRSSHKTNNDLIHETKKYNTIINYLQYLKILPYKVNLSKLMNIIKHCSHIESNLNPTGEISIKEINACFDEINEEIFEKERNISLRLSEKCQN